MKRFSILLAALLALATVAIGIIIILNTIVTKITKDRKGV